MASEKLESIDPIVQLRAIISANSADLRAGGIYAGSIVSDPEVWSSVAGQEILAKWRTYLAEFGLDT